MARCVTGRTIDPEGAELAALGKLVDFAGLRVLEVGCGDGRLTWRYAGEAASVLATDPDGAPSAALAVPDRGSSASACGSPSQVRRTSRCPGRASIWRSSPGRCDDSPSRASCTLCAESTRRFDREGILLDLMPFEAWVPVENRAGVVGHVDAREFARDVVKTEAGLSSVVDAGLFAPERELELDVLEHFDSARASSRLSGSGGGSDPGPAAGERRARRAAVRRSGAARPTPPSRSSLALNSASRSPRPGRSRRERTPRRRRSRRRARAGSRWRRRGRPRLRSHRP